MITYKVYKNKHKGTTGYGKWYGRVYISETYDLDKLSEHMANHNTPFSKGAIKGVLTDMVNCIRELVLDGKAVKIPNLAIFSLGIRTKPADDPAAFGPKNIKWAKLRARSAGSLMTAQVTQAAQFHRQGDTVVTSGGSSSSSDTGQSSGGAVNDGDNVGG